MSSKVIKWFIRQASFRRNSDKSTSTDKGTSSSSKRNPEDKRKLSFAKLSFRKKKKKPSDSTLQSHPQSPTSMGGPDSTPEGADDTSTNVSNDKDSECAESPIRSLSPATTSPSESSAINSPSSESYDESAFKTSIANTTKPLPEVSIHSSHDSDFKSTISQLPPQLDDGAIKVLPPSEADPEEVDSSPSSSPPLNKCPEFSVRQLPPSTTLETDETSERVAHSQNEDRKDEKEDQFIGDKTETETDATLPLSVEQTFDEILELNNIDVSSFKCSGTVIDNKIYSMTFHEQSQSDALELVDDEAVTWSSSKEEDELVSVLSDSLITHVNEASCGDDIEFIDSEGLTNSESEDINTCSITEKDSESESDLCTVANLPDRSDPSTTEQVTETISQTSSTDDKSNDVTFQSIDSCSSAEVEAKAPVKIVVTEPSPELEKHSVVFAPPLQTSPPTTPDRKSQPKRDDYPVELNPFGEDDDDEESPQNDLMNANCRSAVESTSHFGRDEKTAGERPLNGQPGGHRFNASEEKEVSKNGGSESSNPFGDYEDDDEEDTSRFSPTNPFSLASPEGRPCADLPPRLPPKSDIPRRKANAPAIPIPHPRRTKQRLHGSFTSLQSVPVCPVPAPRTLTPTSSSKNLDHSEAAEDGGYFQRNAFERSSVQVLPSSCSQGDFTRNDFRHGSVPASSRVRINRKKRPAPLPPAGKTTNEGASKSPPGSIMSPPSGGGASPSSPSDSVFFSLPRRPSGNRESKKQDSTPSPSYLSMNRPPPRPPPPKKSLS